MPNQKLFDAVLDNALKVFRLIASQKKATFARLKALEKELVGKLAEEAVTTRQARRVETFLKETDRLIEKRYQQLQLELDLWGIGDYVAGETRHDLRIILGIDAIHLPTKDYFDTLGSNFLIMGSPSADWWRGQSQDLSFKFAQQVRQGLTNAETNQQIISRITGKFGEPGIMDVARNHAATLVQTSVQAVANESRRKTFEANPDVIKGIEQVSTLDSHTSLTCISYSGCQWDLSYKPIGPKAKQKPYNGGTPRHFNCRSLETPITKTFKELGLNIPEPKPSERASESGPIPANTSFNDYLNRRGKAYQDEMLGKGRADLWRAGSITLKDLISANGRPLSLAELQALAKKRR